MKVEISNGEVADKWSILFIKLSQIKEEAALNNIQKEFVLLDSLIGVLYRDFNLSRELVDKLYGVNIALWEVEDKLRIMEAKQEFGKHFIKAARSVYLFNDDRARIKKEINEQTNSFLVEEKSYTSYTRPSIL